MEKKLENVKFGEVDRGDILHIYNKEVIVIAKVEPSTVIVRFMNDTEGKHPTRCYMYDIDDLQKEKDKQLKEEFHLEVQDKYGCVIKTTAITYYPNNSTIEKVIKEVSGGYRAKVSRYFVYD